MMRRIFKIAVVWLAAAGSGTAMAAEDVVARAGGVEVTSADLRAHLDGLPENEREALAGDPALLSQTVRLYLAGRLVLKEARDRKFDQRPEIRTQLDRVRDAKLAELYLQATGKAADGIPSESELQAAYDANRAAFIPPRSYRLAQIFVAGPPEARNSAKLDDVLKRLGGRGGDFAAVAREFSDNKAEAGKDGEIGWLTEPQIVPAIARALSGLGKGATTEPVRLDDGWHIVKLLDSRPAGTQPLPLAEVRGALAERLRQQRGMQTQQALLSDLIRRNPPVINELALSRLIPQRK
jgi:peptidylprolyl isomerase